MILRPGNDDMDRRDLPAHAASKASRVASARKAIPDGAAPMAAIGRYAAIEASVVD